MACSRAGTGIGAERIEAWRCLRRGELRRAAANAVAEDVPHAPARPLELPGYIHRFSPMCSAIPDFPWNAIRQHAQRGKDVRQTLDLIQHHEPP